jgi:hypothetical protein
MKRLMFALTLAALPVVAIAGTPTDTIGSWEFSSEQSAFKEGASTAIAVTFDGGMAVALRCLRGNLSVAILSGGGILRAGEYTEGETFQVRFRVGSGAIEEYKVTAISDSLLQLHDSADLIRQIGQSSNFAFQLNRRGIQSEHSFHTRGNGKVADKILKSCEDNRSWR